MTLDSFHRFVHTLPGVTEDFPFDEKVLALRIGGKIFALTDVEARPLRVNLKCDPERAVELRAEHEEIAPGYHVSKTHWNFVTVESGLPASLVRELIEHSYDLVRASLPKKVRAELPGRGE